MNFYLVQIIQLQNKWVVLLLIEEEERHQQFLCDQKINSNQTIWLRLRKLKQGKFKNHHMRKLLKKIYKQHTKETHVLPYKRWIFTTSNIFYLLDNFILLNIYYQLPPSIEKQYKKHQDIKMKNQINFNRNKTLNSQQYIMLKLHFQKQTKYKSIDLLLMKLQINIFLIFTVLLSCTTQLDWQPVEDAIYEGINEGYFSGCVLAVVTNATTTIYQKAFGTTTPRNDIYGTHVTTDMHFDINFLTQVVGIGNVLMWYYDNNKLNITDRVSKYLTEFDNNGKRLITIQNVMLHNSGLMSDWTDPLISQADFLKKLDNSKLIYTTQAKYAYSELGYVILGQMIRKISNTTLDQAFFQILVELGMRDTVYNPTISPELIVPGGYFNGIAIGKSFNRYTRLLNGQSGNAGLFSTIGDLLNFMKTLLNKGHYPVGGQKMFEAKTIELFTKPVVYKAYKNTRASGWDTVPDVNPPCGRKFSANSFGLSDISGSYIWADKDKNVSIILLANGGYPYPANDVNIFQGKLSDAIMKVLGY